MPCPRHCMRGNSFLPFGEDPQRYAWNSRLVPQSCEADVVTLLAEVHRRTIGRIQNDPAAFDAVQNAVVAANAERYYRTMIRGDRQSWNIRDHHMSDTIDRVAAHHGPGSKGLVWAHNTHIGDARATDMARGGMVNIGQLMRQRHPGEVLLAGFASYSGSVTAAEAWGASEQIMGVPDALPDSHEDLLNQVLGDAAVLLFGPDRSGPWLTAWHGHRAIGVVYDPRHEAGNYVPTRMAGRYDAVLWFPQTAALRPLHHEQQPGEPELETEPTGFLLSGEGEEELLQVLLVHCGVFADDALLQAAGYDGEPGPVQSLRHCRQLGDDVLAVPALLQHPSDGRELALRPLEAVDHGGQFS